MGDLGSAPLLYSARPTLVLDGVADAALEDGLVSLVTEEDCDGMHRCEATIGNWGSAGGEVGFLYFDRQVLEFGMSLAIEIGAGSAAAQVFEGRITALEGRFPKLRPPEILVLAEDRLQDLRMTRRTRVFEDASVETVIRAIAANHGLTPQIDIDGPTWPALAQLNQSDLAFLRQRARDVDAELWVRGDQLFAQARARRPAEAVTLTYGQGLHELQIAADLAEQCSSVTVGGWDVAAKDAVNHQAGPQTLAGESEGETGSEVLEAAFGERRETIVHRLPLSTGEAEALADAAYRQRARRFLRGEAVAEGDGRLRVGRSVRLRGVGRLFDGDYTVTAVRHVFDLDQGFRSEFSVERPWIGG